MANLNPKIEEQLLKSIFSLKESNRNEESINNIFLHAVYLVPLTILLISPLLGKAIAIYFFGIIAAVAIPMILLIQLYFMVHSGEYFTLHFDIWANVKLLFSLYSPFYAALLIGLTMTALYKFKPHTFSSIKNKTEDGELVFLGTYSEIDWGPLATIFFSFSLLPTIFFESSFLENISYTDYFMFTMDNVLHSIALDIFDIFEVQIFSFEAPHDYVFRASMQFFRLMFDLLFISFIVWGIFEKKKIKAIKRLVERNSDDILDNLSVLKYAVSPEGHTRPEWIKITIVEYYLSKNFNGLSTFVAQEEISEDAIPYHEFTVNGDPIFDLQTTGERNTLIYIGP